MKSRTCFWTCLFCALSYGILTTTLSAAEPLAVNESAREIPVAYEVDVVVVGGGTGAVQSAVTAAEAGASVFLAAPYPYLGDDMTATLRLWLEEGEVPESALAQRIFTDPVQIEAARDPNTLSFVYTANRPSSTVHLDTDPPSKLTDGIWSDAARHSVQYDGDVTIICDLERADDVEAARIMPFFRASSNRPHAFVVKRVTVSISSDKQEWQQIETIENKSSDDVTVLQAHVGKKTRYIKFDVQKSDDCDRILIGEIEITGPPPPGQEPIPSYPTPRPLHVKKTLDTALIDAGVTFLYSCLPTDVLRDADGNPCGVVFANRAGRQAVIAKTIIDATDRAVVARMAGAKAKPFVAGTQTFKRVVIGGEIQQGEGMMARTAGPPFVGRYPNAAKTSSGHFPVIEYSLNLNVPQPGISSWAAADQKARSATYDPEQQATSDVLFQVPSDPLKGEEQSTGAWAGVSKLPLGAFRPAGVPHVYLLNGGADVSREQAEKLLRPLALMELGERIGKTAGQEAQGLAKPKGAHLPGKTAEHPAKNGDVREILVGVRPTQELPTIPQQARSLPVLGEYDVVVIGGGTAGAPAGIGAARQGAKTLVVEYLSGLGGVGTLGAISKYYWGNRVGFTATVEGGASWVPEQRMEWWRRQLLDAGADIWFGTIGCGAFVEDGHVRGAVVATPFGRGVVLSKVVIDATGNSDIAAAAGAESIYTDETELAMQGTGLPGRKLGATYTNTDFTIVDETDLLDVWHVYVYAKDKYANDFDQGRLIDTRERRRIVGDFTMSLLDQVNGRTYPDTVVVARSNFDTHGYTIEPYLELEHPHHVGFFVNVPYRCMLPKGLKGILVGGLGMSVHRDAVPLTRMQPDLQNQGYALGVAAAMAVRDGVELRKINLRALQQHLIEIGNMPESVLGAEDNFPFPIERVKEAVASVTDEYKGAAILVGQPEQAIPLLRDAYASAEGDARTVYAHVLAVLGDATGAETLISKINEASEWDEGWNYRGMGQFGRALSPLDRWIMALGRAGDRKAVPAVLAKTGLLTAEHDFSHHRAVALALELIGDPAAAKPLAALLAKPGMSGYVHDTLEKASERDQEEASTVGVKTRRESMRELILARALYRCGDHEGIGRGILEAYTHDLRGHLARHAKAVLASERKTVR